MPVTTDNPAHKHSTDGLNALFEPRLLSGGLQRADIFETLTVAISATGRQSNRYCDLPTLVTSLYPKNDSASSRVLSMVDL